MKFRIVQKKINLLMVSVLTILISMLFVGCDTRHTSYYIDGDEFTPPPVPTGVTTITGDEIIWIQWNPIIGVGDLEGYRIYRSTDNHLFFFIVSVSTGITEYADYGVENGITYYYGVSSFDIYGNESDVSFDYQDAYDTPRPEGTEQIYSLGDPEYDYRSGFDFSREERIFFDDPLCDIFLEYDDTPGINTYFIWLGDNGFYIQDMGYTDSFDDITYAPDDGWSEFDYVEAIIGHTYVLLTADNHYAKVRVLDFDSSPAYRMTFDWGYQIDQGNRELRIAPPPIKEMIIVDSPQ